MASQLTVFAGFVAVSEPFITSHIGSNPIVNLNCFTTDLIRSYLLISLESSRMKELMDGGMRSECVLGMLPGS